MGGRRGQKAAVARKRSTFEAVAIVRCTECRAEREIMAGEIPDDEVPMCEKCFSPMYVVRATTKVVQR